MGIERWRALVWLLLLVFLPACSDRTQAQETRPLSLVVLLDFSESFAPLAPHERTLRLIAGATQRIAKDGPPVLIAVLAIGEASRLRRPPCGPPVEFRPRMIPGAQRQALSRQEDLARWLDECVRTVLEQSKKPTPYTDISGAIAEAAEAGKGDFRERVVFVLSDFQEDRVPGTPPVRYQLQGERFVLLYAPESEDRKDQNRLDRRVKEWEATLKGAGSRSVCSIAVATASEKRLLGCLK